MVRKKFVILYGLLSIAIAILVTFPLITHISSIFLGAGSGDNYNYAWNIDTFWHEVSRGKNPFYTDRIFYPHGTNLIFHTYAPFISILGAVFLSNPVAFLNLLIVLSLSVSSLVVALFVRRITKKTIPSVIAGMVYGFSPIFLAFIESQHIYFLFAAPFLALGAWVFYEFSRTKHIRFFSSLLLLFWVIFFIDYYSAVLYAIILFFSFLSYGQHIFQYFMKQKSFPKELFLYLRAFFLWFLLPLIATIFLLFTPKELSKRAQTQNNFYPQICSADLVRFFTPSENSIFLGDHARSLQARYSLGHDFDTPSIYVGMSVFTIAVITLLFSKEKFTRLCGLLAIVIFLITLGPSIQFGKQSILTSIPNVYQLFQRLPFMSLIDCPKRLHIGTQLYLSILVGIGLAKLTGKWRVLSLVAIILCIIEYLPSPLPYEKIEIPTVYKELAKNTDQRSVLELPSGISESKGAFGYDWSISFLHTKQLYWQTISKKPRVGGYTSRIDAQMYTQYRSEPVLSDIFTMTSLDGHFPNITYTNEQVVAFLRKYNIGYMILSPNSRQAYFSTVIEKNFILYIDRKITTEGYILYTLRSV